MSWQSFVELIGLLADVVTIAVGLAAVFAVIFKRRELGALLAALTSAFFGQRASRIKETLGRLESLSYDRKEERPEISALLGQICGQLESLVREYPSLQMTYDQLLEFVNKKKRLSEAHKRRLIYELHGALDSAGLRQHRDLLKERKQ